MKLALTPWVEREISWLEFNGRVLQEAADETNPLIERLKFLGIFSSNLDEFYRVRVATLNRMNSLKAGNAPVIIKNPKKILKEITRIDKKQQKEFVRIYQQIIQQLASEGIHLLNEKQITPRQGAFIHAYFNEHVRSQLFPILLNNLKLSSLIDKSIYLAVLLRRSRQEAKDRFAVVRIPVRPLSRFVILPNDDENIESGQGKVPVLNIIMLDDVIRYSLEEIFAVFGFDHYEAYTFKFTRDAEMDIDNDVSKSFLEIMVESLKQRKTGAAVRFVYDREMPATMLKMLKEKLGITVDDSIITGGRYHNFKDLISFPSPGRPDLQYAPMPPLPQKGLLKNSSIFSLLKHRDMMLHTPYQSFSFIIDLLREASIDPQVRAIKMTLYRVAKNSNVINALINASRNGKAVTVFMELQARFDEEANISWAEKLQEEGVKLIQGTPGFKVHSKLLLIRRKEDNTNVYYANIGTGNFNEQTAATYADDSLLTCRQEITEEVNKVFHLFESKFTPLKFKHLVVSPFHMRDYFIKLLNSEIRNAKKGLDAWCIIKLNNLSDDQLVKKLYQAGREGVKISIICRSTCAIVPGIPGVSDNIRVISIVDRFLEHSRVLIFANGDKPLYYISSADWMIRNLDARIEVACPVYDKNLQQELRTMLMIQLKDNTKARLVNHDPPNVHVSGKLPVVRSQEEIYKYFR